MYCAGKINDKGIFHLNKAGALFFAKDLAKFNLDYEIKMARFDGNSRDIFLSKKNNFKINFSYY